MSLVFIVCYALQRRLHHTRSGPIRLLSTSNLMQTEINLKWTKYKMPVTNQTLEICEASEKGVDAFLEEAIESESSGYGTVQKEPFGVVTWDSAFIVAELLDRMYSASSKDNLKGKVVADMGCGTGVGTLSSIVLNAKKVIAIDFNNYSLEMLRLSYKRLIANDDKDNENNNNENNDKKNHVMRKTNVLFKYFDLEGSEPLPICDILIMSDIT